MTTDLWVCDKHDQSEWTCVLRGSVIPHIKLPPKAFSMTTDKTAMQQLVDELESALYEIEDKTLFTYQVTDRIYQRAKSLLEVEKKQIIQAYNIAFEDCGIMESTSLQPYANDAQDYFLKTYNQNK
jgi:hypothetical protein